MSNLPPILVTGSHRSGSTWIGKTLSASEDIAYLHEPFNVPYGIIRRQFENWYQYICQENEQEHQFKIDNVINYRYPLLQQVRIRSNTKDRLKALRDYTLFKYNKLSKKRPLLKDPIALLSTEWLQNTYKMQVLISVRHPAAFCSSLLLKNWHFDFNNLAQQKLAMNGPLKPFKEDILKYSTSKVELIDQSILLWRIVHNLILNWKNTYKDWIIVRHEDLSLNPEVEFEHICKNLNIPYTNRIKNTIKASSGSHNPVEQISGKEFTRDSKKNIKNWIQRLSTQQIDYIRLNTEEISSHFYGDEDWKAEEDA